MQQMTYHAGTIKLMPAIAHDEVAPHAKTSQAQPVRRVTATRVPETFCCSM
jgi:hypothetical protein